MTKRLLMGIGGAGEHLARRMSEVIEGDLLFTNTDTSQWPGKADRYLQLGPETCKGQSALTAQKGKRAARESLADISSALDGYQTVVAIAGLGGGTGSGALPLVASHVLSLGAARLLAVVVLPFEFEGLQRRPIAMESLSQLMALGADTEVLDLQQAANDLAKQEFLLNELLAGASNELTERVKLRLQVIEASRVTGNS